MVYFPDGNSWENYSELNKQLSFNPSSIISGAELEIIK